VVRPASSGQKLPEPGCVGKGAPLAVFFRPLTEVVTVTEFVTYTIDEGCRMKERFWEKWSNQFV